MFVVCITSYSNAVRKQLRSAWQPSCHKQWCFSCSVAFSSKCCSSFSLESCSYSLLLVRCSECTARNASEACRVQPRTNIKKGLKITRQLANLGCPSSYFALRSGNRQTFDRNPERNPRPANFSQRENLHRGMGEPPGGNLKRARLAMMKLGMRIWNRSDLTRCWSAQNLGERLRKIPEQG